MCQKECWETSAAQPVFQDMKGDTVKSKNKGGGLSHALSYKLICQLSSLSSCRCSIGYYGNPTLPGSVCSQCNCSGWGSLQPLCDVLSGKCNCKAGVKGRSCDLCEDRHILQEGECVCKCV